MLLAADEAFSKTFGLVITFGGIGLIVTVIVIYILVQLRGERRQNQDYVITREPPGT
jgi:ABC-type transporter Mla subunit MlaD